MSENIEKLRKRVRKRRLKTLAEWTGILVLSVAASTATYYFLIRRQFNHDVDKGFNQGYYQAQKDLVKGVDEYTLNSEFLFYNPSNYEEEKKALSKISFVEKDNIKNAPKTSLDSIVKNSISIGRTTEMPRDTHWFGKSPSYEELHEEPFTMLFNYKGAANGLLVSNQGHILTDLHVVENLDLNGDNRFYVSKEDGTSFYIKGILAYSKAYDLALLKSNMKVDINPIVLLSEQTLESGSKVFTIGRINNQSTSYRNHQITIESELEHFTSTGVYLGTYPIISSKNGGILVKALAIDNGARKGYSGSVVVNSNGQILGILSIGSTTRSYAAESSKMYGLVSFYLSQLAKSQQEKQ